MAVVTWLHLSDLHFKSGAEFEEFNREIVLEILWDDIKNQIAKGLKPDFIVFTGDVAYHGRRDEYGLAVRHFFDPLLETTGLSKDKLFIVPGNHDVDWDEIDPIITPGMRQLLTNRDQINEFLSPTRDRSLAFRKFNAYAEFINAYFEGALTFSDTEYFYARSVEAQGHKLDIIGLNSAWMSAYVRDDQGNVQDQGRLLIGERQLLRALKTDEKAELRIVLLHHPIGWLHETDLFEVQNRLSAECDIVLHGHWHVPQVKASHSMAGRAVYIPAGAVYAHRDYPNGYNFVQANLDSGQATVFLRRYNDTGPKGPQWIKDIQSTGEELDGVFEFGLFQDVSETALPVAPATANRILLVEDKVEWQKAIESILLPPDFDLEIASSFAKAKSKLQERFDLILVNLCLVDDSDYEGVALLDDLLEVLDEDRVPCIVLTGTATTMRGLFERYNVREIFVKGRTFNKAKFLQEVKEVVKS